ncbi:MAG: twin-arginine translocase TatA/TatE family subunit [Candidatus Kapabacteria bacterium]|nr:twin-arginine translocase TatA/TatE family subunit [Ignavibacteriota bacterium]MCW5885686.1 twin-arginine translocase TatA/TatE family subunit [Candidatus Kapabacteria bacterium]
MFDVGGGELIFIILAILVLFGPKKIPEFAKMIKKGITEVKRAQASFTEQITDVSGEINKQTASIKSKVEQDLDLKNDQKQS